MDKVKNGENIHMQKSLFFTILHVFHYQLSVYLLIWMSWFIAVTDTSNNSYESNKLVYCYFYYHTHTHQ